MKSKDEQFHKDLSLFFLSFFLSLKSRLNSLFVFSTPIMNAIVFKKIEKKLGGRMKWLASGLKLSVSFFLNFFSKTKFKKQETTGGAPCGDDTQEFMRVVFGVKVNQGYGLTETAAAGTVCDSYEPFNYNTCSRAGNIVSSCYIKVIIIISFFTHTTLHSHNFLHTVEIKPRD